ncbi:hypothetical protein [Azospirillum canadense]|uniref:hypothetical protein n=1 Tax=Azospirillum canadense TaxID=403962 RepID=UPI002227B6A9|nr:hypothetical protein [Azospirillum canadense]MCW2244249.1 hypothetical protein [Azospirillum canadense]
MRAIPSIAAVLMVAATLSVAPFGAFAQDATKGALANDPAVKQSQEPEPNAQGVRTPKATTSGETQSSELQQALSAVRAAPPDLQGNKMPRPNWLASEPDQPNEPTRSQNPSDLSSQEVK